MMYMGFVAPLAGARIEMQVKIGNVVKVGVAPLAGARIEIIPILYPMRSPQSLPSRERGLKCTDVLRRALADCVAPLAGARIEICASGS